MILALIIIVGVFIAVLCIIPAGRALRRLTVRRWPFAVGCGVMLAAAVIPAVIPLPGSVPVRLVAVAAVLCLIASLVCFAALLGDEPRVDGVHGWAAAHGVSITEYNSDFVVAYVLEGHRLRLVCGIGGFTSAAALSAGTGIDLRASGWIWLLSGYLVGVVWSQGWLTRLPAGTQRAASLVPRRIVDYLPRSMITAQAVTALGTVGLAAVAIAGGSNRTLVSGLATDFGTASAGSLQLTVIWMAVAATVLVVGVGLLQRRIVGKAQPAADSDLLAADDAVRASAVNLLSGTTIAIVLLLVGTQLRALAAMGIVADEVAALGFAVCFVAAAIAWRGLGRRGWVVRRHLATNLRHHSLKGSMS